MNDKLLHIAKNNASVKKKPSKIKLQKVSIKEIERGRSAAYSYLFE